MKFIAHIATALLLVVSVGCAKSTDKNPADFFDDHNGKIDTKQFPNVTNTIYGGWLSSRTSLTGAFRFFINRNTFAVSMECANGKGVASAQVSAQVSNNEFQIIGSATGTAKDPDGREICSVSIRPRIFSYRVNGDRAEISSNGESASLTRLPY